MSILNEARMNTENFIDFLYTSFIELFEKKPRDYREIAHTDFIAYTKKRKPNSKIRRKAKRKQLNYLRRNIKRIDNTLSSIEDIDGIDNWELVSLKNRHEVIKKVYDQQFEMFVKKTRSVKDRIVSISQPHVRPIVRGKAGKAVEFGAKISLSVVEGFSYIDHLSWDSFNESQDLIPQIEKYKERFGYLPESVHADKIYQTRANRKFCKDNDIRMTGKPLGRPRKETDKNKEELESERKQRYQDDVDRIVVEGRFGVAKRKYGMGLIKSKLKDTSETEIFMSVLMLNLDKICTVEITEIKNKYKIRRKKSA